MCHDSLNVSRIGRVLSSLSSLNRWHPTSAKGGIRALFLSVVVCFLEPEMHAGPPKKLGESRLSMQQGHAMSDRVSILGKTVYHRYV